MADAVGFLLSENTQSRGAVFSLTLLSATNGRVGKPPRVTTPSNSILGTSINLGLSRLRFIKEEISSSDPIISNDGTFPERTGLLVTAAEVIDPTFT
jgi:hypothetical protein